MNFSSKERIQHIVHAREFRSLKFFKRFQVFTKNWSNNKLADRKKHLLRQILKLIVKLVYGPRNSEDYLEAIDSWPSPILYRKVFIKVFRFWS